MMRAELARFMDMGGPALWVIAALSVLTAAVILWKIWRLSLMGVWSGQATTRAVALWRGGDRAGAIAMLDGRRSIRARVAHTAMRAIATWAEPQAREETTRVARGQLAQMRAGLRILELIATIAPLVGLLGTVLGMIEAFQALQAAGTRADPSALAGGIWEALLTTAAGMAVAIPASVSLTWFEGVTERVQGDLEDQATQIFLAKDAV